MHQSKVCGPRRVYSRAVPTLSHEMVCVKGVYEERVCCRRRRRRRFRRCHPVAPGKCESRVTEYGALEFARGLPPLSHNPGSWIRLRHWRRHWRRHRRRHPHPASRDGGQGARTREGFAAQRRQCGGWRAPLAGAAAGRRRSELRRVTSRRKTNRRQRGDQALGFFGACFCRKEFLNASPSQSTLARQGRGLAHTSTSAHLLSLRKGSDEAVFFRETSVW